MIWDLPCFPRGHCVGENQANRSQARFVSIAPKKSGIMEQAPQEPDRQLDENRQAESQVQMLAPLICRHFYSKLSYCTRLAGIPSWLAAARAASIKRPGPQT